LHHDILWVPRTWKGPSRFFGKFVDPCECSCMKAVSVASVATPCYWQSLKTTVPLSKFHNTRTIQQIPRLKFCQVKMCIMICPPWLEMDMFAWVQPMKNLYRIKLEKLV
jgi:hypothetical protein